MIEHADDIITLGLWFSGVALLGVAWVIRDLWRRPFLPEAAYGGVSLTPRRVRWLWTWFLVGATALGSARNPIVHTTTNTDDPEAQAAAPRGAQRRTVSRTVPLPFYRYERQDVALGGVPVSSHEMKGFVLPTPLLWALLAYLFLVVRFNPDSWWTRRILHGRKEARASRDDQP